jgi:hypothetical protein
MKILRSILALSLIAALAVSFTSCKKDDPAPVTLSAATATNIAADPPSGGYNPTNGQAIGVTKKFTLFSFSTGKVVANADSASAKWDIGFNSTNIIVNGGTSGPGQGSGQVVSGIFADIGTAPTTGFVQDNKSATPTAIYAIPRGSANGWYTYNQSTNIVSPTAGKVLIFKTADGKYAKMEIISYYKDAPTAPTSTSVDRYYTFRYVYQGDGTTKFN